MLDHQAPKLCEEALRQLELGRHHLDERSFRGIALGSDEDSEAIPAVGDEEQPRRHTRQRAPLFELDHRPPDGPFLEAPRRAAPRHQLRERGCI